ncbi:unnamed protein product [Ixodes pacificus]
MASSHSMAAASVPVFPIAITATASGEGFPGVVAGPSFSLASGAVSVRFSPWTVASTLLLSCPSTVALSCCALSNGVNDVAASSASASSMRRSHPSSLARLTTALAYVRAQSWATWPKPRHCPHRGTRQSRRICPCLRHRRHSGARPGTTTRIVPP